MSLTRVESVPIKDIEEVTTLAPNDSLKDTINDDELDPIENIADYPTLDPKDSVNDDEQVTVVDVTAKTLPSSLAGLVFILLHLVTYCDFSRVSLTDLIFVASYITLSSI